MTVRLGDNSLGYIIDRVDVGILVVTETLDVVLWLSLIHISEPTRPY